MSLNNIKQLTKKEGGFTIVELLIVIVIIAILAAITIVAYNGIQNRAKTSSAQSLANTVAKKAEAYNAIQTGYPATRTAFGDVAESKLDNPALVTGTAPTNEKTVQYLYCDAGKGYQVVYFDAVANATKIVTGGTTVSCAAPAS